MSTILIILTILNVLTVLAILTMLTVLTILTILTTRTEQVVELLVGRGQADEAVDECLIGSDWGRQYFST